jgi:hypothetical protein
MPACRNIPADPNDSFAKALKSGLYVGYTTNPPWISDENGRGEGIEAEIISGFAEENKMQIKWEYGSEQELMKKLEKKELHIVITGLTKDTPWKDKKVGITMPYFKNKKEQHIIAVQQGENKLTMKIEKLQESA